MVLTAAGYLIPFEKMHVWFRWIFYLNPGSYAFVALMANEFTGLKLDCIEPDYIPYGTGYPDSSSAYRGCSVLGSDENGLIDGAAYIREQYHYSHGHIWRSFGVIIGMWAFFIFLTSVGFEKLNSQGGSSVLLYKRGSQKKRTPDMEKGQQHMSQPAANTGALANTAKQSTFTWNNLDYHVPFHGEKKQLLNQVFGYVKPGNLVALMGCSGAGKTTYQMDVHEASATVREALEFSALLRQPASVPREEKLAYVDHIIDLLELSDISDALIGSTLSSTILCTIHQPSAVLFDAFDSLLLLAKGAGQDSAKVLDYFAKNGAPCEPDVNPAEHIVEVIQGNTEKKIDWVEVWNQSEERQRAMTELEALNNDRKANTQEEEDQSDFATSHWFQFKMVLRRLMIQLWRSPVSYCSLNNTMQ
ncbi:unnamed protein product [Aspergillus oryzae]|nr:unnamed protein product [Aspergillus oryzae]